MDTNALERCKALAEGVTAETHEAHALVSTIFRQLVSKNAPDKKWYHLVNAVQRLPKEMQHAVLNLAEAIPAFQFPKRGSEPGDV